MRVEYADISLLGGREENQDRVTAVVAENAEYVPYAATLATEPMTRRLASTFHAPSFRV